MVYFLLSVQSLCSFRMTLCVRLLRGGYTEFNEVLAMTKRGVIAMAGENLWKVTGNYQNEAPCGKPQGISMEKIVSLVTAMTRRECHCEEQSDEAIQKRRDCFANARNDKKRRHCNDSGNPVASYKELSN